MSFMVKHYYREPESEWILDSSPTGHMCYNRKAFESPKRHLNKQTVYLGERSEIRAYRIGTVCLNPETVLKVVLYVPGFAANL